MTPIPAKEEIGWTNLESPTFTQWNAKSGETTTRPLSLASFGLDYDVATDSYLMTSPTGVHRLSSNFHEDAIVFSTSQVSGVATNVSNGLVYWHNLNASSIQRANADGSGVQTVLKDIPIQYQFDVDSVTGDLYWSDPTHQTIWRGDALGNRPTPLAQNVTTYSVQLDGAAEYVYWWNPINSRIQRTPTTGGGVVEDVAVTRGFTAALSLLQVDRRLLANDDIQADSDVRPEVVNPPSHGTVTLERDGTFNYIPLTGFIGSDGFDYALRDAQQNLSAVAHVHLEVVDRPPLALDDTYYTTEDSSLSVVGGQGVLTNDQDTRTVVLTAHLTTPPQHGTLRLDETGSFDYQPDPDFAGPDVFTYQAFDGAAYSQPATVRIQVTAQPDPPHTVPDRYIYLDGETGIYTGTLRFPNATGSLAEIEPNSTSASAQLLPQADLALVSSANYRPARRLRQFARDSPSHDHRNRRWNRRLLSVRRVQARSAGDIRY